MGLSPGGYAALTVALTFAQVVVCLGVSTLIVWRRSHDCMALLVALLLVTFGPLNATSTVLASPSPWQVPNQCLFFLANALVVLVFLLFPTGRFVPHWMRWTSVVLLAGLVPLAFIAPLTLNTPLGWLVVLVFLGELATLVVVQVHRYRQVSSPLERQLACVDLPNARRARVALSARRGNHHHLPKALDPALVWVRHAALSAVGH